jgi:hypothetical protein
MNEEKNIEDQPEDIKPPTSNDSENSAEGTLLSSEENKTIAGEDIPHSTPNIQHNNEKMEVHKHPHHVTHKKKWGEYFLEFFMLFLAVFLGFVAENVREHSVERQHEKEYIRGLVQNLKSDTAQLTRKIATNIKKRNVWDSLMSLSNVELALPENARKFYDYFIKGSFIPTFNPSDAALLQLKNAGKLRLLTNKNIADSILAYDAYNKVIVSHNQEFLERGNEMWNAAYPIMQGKIMSDTSYVDFFNRREVISQKNVPPLILNNRDLQMFFGQLARTLLFTDVNRHLMIQQNGNAERLILLLQKQYHLENE